MCSVRELAIFNFPRIQSICYLNDGRLLAREDCNREMMTHIRMMQFLAHGGAEIFSRGSSVKNEKFGLVSYDVHYE